MDRFIAIDWPMLFHCLNTLSIDGKLVDWSLLNERIRDAITQKDATQLSQHTNNQHQQSLPHLTTAVVVTEDPHISETSYLCTTPTGTGAGELVVVGRPDTSVASGTSEPSVHSEPQIEGMDPEVVLNIPSEPSVFSGRPTDEPNHNDPGTNQPSLLIDHVDENLSTTINHTRTSPSMSTFDVATQVISSVSFPDVSPKTVHHLSEDRLIIEDQDRIAPQKRLCCEQKLREHYEHEV